VTETWTFGPADGELHILTGVAGPGAKMGHQLTIRIRTWQASVQWQAARPAAMELSADVGSLEVLEGHGGMTPLTGPEKIVVRSNALKSLDAKKFPTIRFAADTITDTGGGYLLDGTLEIHGTSRPQTVDLSVADDGDHWALSADTPVAQTAFGIKPFSLLMGTLKVADEVTVRFSATHSTSRQTPRSQVR
jgi:polyisoprenoid-binding protein YceI